MAESQSKKALKHKLRNGKPDPRAMRGSWGTVKPVVRVKENKKKEAKNEGNY